MTRDARAATVLGELAALEVQMDGGDDAHGAVPIGRAHLDATRALLVGSPSPFDEAQPEHVTASAFVVSARGVVLLRHRLLGIWVQPGGHVERDESPHAAAIREVAEETGLVAEHLDPPALVDVDVHPEPRGHRHYDCRWLLLALPAPLVPGPKESHDLDWFLPPAALARCEPGLVSGLGRAFAAARRRGVLAVASWPS